MYMFGCLPPHLNNVSIRYLVKLEMLIVHMLPAYH